MRLFLYAEHCSILKIYGWSADSVKCSREEGDDDGHSHEAQGVLGR